MKSRYPIIVGAASLVGATVGVGVFGVPYAVSQIGWPLAIAFFVVLGGIQLLQHLFYAEAAIAATDEIRLISLVGRYVARPLRHVAAVALLGGSWAAIIAYLLVGGDFLHALFNGALGGSIFAYQMLWAALAAGLLMFGFGMVERVSFIGTVGKVAAMAVILGICVLKVKTDNLGSVVADPFLPYGVILFSLSGASAVPEMEALVGGDRRRYRLAVIVGSLASTLLVLLFGFLVYGVTGDATTPDAVSGLKGAVGGVFPRMAAAFGFLAVVTSFIAVGLDLKNTFALDYRFRPVLAWAATIGVPLAFLLLGLRDFLPVVGFSGAVFGGTVAILIAAMYVRLTKKGTLGDNRLGVPSWAAYFVIAVLGLGVAVELATSAYDLLKAAMV